MKKICKILSVIILFVCVAAINGKEAYAASANLTGPATVRPGDTITLNLSVNDDGKVGFEGELNFDSTQVSYSSVGTSLKDWKVEKNNNKLVIYDDTLANPLNGTKTVISLKFTVNNSVKSGDNVKIAIKNLVATDGTNESTYANVEYSVTIAEPLSSNADLSALSVDGLTITPGFAAGTTTYNAGEVEFSTSKVNVKYTAADSKAKVAVTGTNLNVGANKITVTVTAESGVKKTYTINVTRKQDPDYKASSDATLKSLTVNEGKISPAFSKNTTEYIVYLPYEFVGKSITATGSASDAKASGVTNGKANSLVEGTNEIKVVCKAEDGTEKTYKVTVVVMPKFAGAVPNIEGVEINTPEEPTTEEPTTEKITQSETTFNYVEPLKDVENNSTSPLVIIIIVIVAAAMGFVGCYLLFSRNLLR